MNADPEQLRQKLHELEIEQNKLNAQLVMFEAVEDDHESRKVRNLRRIRRLQAKLERFEGKS